MNGFLVLCLALGFVLYVLFSDSESTKGGEKFDEEKLREIFE